MANVFTQIQAKAVAALNNHISGIIAEWKPFRRKGAPMTHNNMTTFRMEIELTDYERLKKSTDPQTLAAAFVQQELLADPQAWIQAMVNGEVNGRS